MDRVAELEFRVQRLESALGLQIELNAMLNERMSYIENVKPRELYEWVLIHTYCPDVSAYLFYRDWEASEFIDIKLALIALASMLEDETVLDSIKRLLKHEPFSFDDFKRRYPDLNLNYLPVELRKPEPTMKRRTFLDE